MLQLHMLLSLRLRLHWPLLLLQEDAFHLLFIFWLPL
jgi:hypothetical protein